MTQTGPSERYHDIENHYPHKFLTTNRQTLPMSLVWTFICLATRFGFDARPVRYPGTVLAAIRLPESNKWLYIDLRGEELMTQTEAEISRRFEPGFPRDLVKPATTQSMIIRAIDNVLVSATREMPQKWPWGALYLVSVFLDSQSLRNQTTESLWGFMLMANDEAPLDLMPILHDRLVGPRGTSASPEKATFIRQEASRRCGEDKAPMGVICAHEGGSGDKERRLAVGMMIGPSQFIVGFTEGARPVTVLDCRNEGQRIRKYHRTRLHFGRVHVLTASRGKISVCDRRTSVESHGLWRGPTAIRRRFIRDRDGGGGSAGTP